MGAKVSADIIPVYTVQDGQFILFEDHLYPIPFAMLENHKDGFAGKNSSNKAVTFKTSNKKIVTVSKKGVVKAKKVGTAKITIKTVEGKRKATIKIKVK